MATITEVANSSIDGLKLKNYDLTRFRLYVPTLIISLILLWIPKFLFIFAMRVIKFKSFSQCDEFVIKVSPSANTIITFFIPYYKLTFIMYLFSGTQLFE